MYSTIIIHTMTTRRCQMKSFRQHIVDSLSTTIKKHKDPYAFAADMRRQQREKKVSLKQRGAASARELVAAWKRRKSN